MKIAFLSTMDFVPWGGSELLWYETAKLALQENHQVFTATCYWEKRPSHIEELAGRGAEIFFRLSYNPALSARVYRRVKSFWEGESAEVKAIKAFDPDRIVLNQGGDFEIFGKEDLRKLLHETERPFYIICHLYKEARAFSDSVRQEILSLFRKAENIFMISQLQADTICKQLVYKLPNIKIISNPLNLKQVGPVVYPAAEPVCFASVASLDVDRKGQDLLLEVLSQEKWRKRNWQLNIYGSGPDRGYLEDLCGYFGVREKVVFQGHVLDINSLWQKNHLLLLSSRIESGPMVLTEAMLCGRTTVATLVGIVPELIVDGENGFVAGAATPTLLDEAMDRAWQKKEQWPAMGLRAYQAALNKMDLHAAESFLGLITKPLHKSN
jgi:glycosyltransferase involved in cell wall biosynthesis